MRPDRMSSALRTFVKSACAAGTTGSKTAQMGIARVMQSWAADEINQRLQRHHITLRANSTGKKFAGGWRGVSVDVHIETVQHGLILALDPKHLQSKESVKKNWKNTLNDLLALASNIHSRFPICVVGGMIGFNKAESDQNMLREMYSILNHVAIRDKATEEYGFMEAFALVIYECDPISLSPNIPPRGSQLRAGAALDRLVNIFVQRYVS